VRREKDSPPKSKIPYAGPWLSLGQYLLTPEAQTFALAVATFAVLAFFPFMIVLIMVIRRVFESRAMNYVLLQILRDHLPIGQDMVIKALDDLVNARKQVQVGSTILLLLATRGVFMPLEVALNRIWGFEKSRSWIHNQLVGALLAIGCAVLALVSIAVTAFGNRYVLTEFVGGGRHNPTFHLGAFLLMKLVTTTASITTFFLIYWLVPAGKVSVRRALPAAIIFGILWELMKYAYIAALPHMNFEEVYGPFSVSVSLIFWAYLSGLLLLSGAYSAAYTHE
jgi:membrane protein